MLFLDNPWLGKKVKNSFWKMVISISKIDYKLNGPAQMWLLPSEKGDNGSLATISEYFRGTSVYKEVWYSNKVFRWVKKFEKSIQNKLWALRDLIVVHGKKLDFVKFILLWNFRSLFVHVRVGKFENRGHFLSLNSKSF